MEIAAAIESATERLNETIVTRPRTVIVVFLLVTAAFAGGVPLVESEEEATDAFAEGLEAQEAFDTINEEFQGPFETDDRTTQLIHVSSDVLTRQEHLAMLRTIERIERRDDLYVESVNGPSVAIAQAIDPTATTPAAQQAAIEGASDRELRTATRQVTASPRIAQSLSSDYNEESLTASASVTVIRHDVPSGFDTDDLADVQSTIGDIAGDEPADIRAFGEGTIQNEFGNIIGDSLAIVMPIVVFLLLTFLVVAYRDPIDLALGLVALLLSIIWTFGFLGYASIPFDQTLIAVPVLLLAVGVDFGIHIINRYREETVTGMTPLPAMRTAANQLFIAFVIVTVTTVFGFGANVISDLEPIRNLGIASSVGITFTFFIFGLFLPAAKLETDRFRERYGVPEFNSEPIASEESALGRLLSVSAVVSRRAPVVFVVALLLIGTGAGVYGAGIDTSFEQEDFLPPETEPGYVDYIPAPFAPGEYTVTSTINLLEERFEASQDESVTIYVEGPFEEDHALEALVAPNDDPTDSLAVGDGGQADAQSIVTVIQSHAASDQEFGALVARNDRNGDGVPERNLDRIYDELFASEAAPQAAQYLTEDRRGAQVEYSVDASASQRDVAADSRAFADDFRYTAAATGNIVIFDAVSDVIFESAIQGLIVALVLTGVFLIISYGVLERKPLLGIANVFPIVIAVALLIGTMRLFGLPLNALTATILSISIGIGIAYSVHITARFVDEYDGTNTPDALVTTLSGTGGALAGSMLTTSLGTGALALAITPILGDFGLLMALSVFYSFVLSIVALPPALFVWARFD